MNRPPDGGAGEAAEWISHAASDLRLAQIAAADGQVLSEMAAFHAQQAAEKALKAVLVHHRADFPRTHDLRQLLELIESIGVQAPPEVAEADLLSPYAVSFRYPGHLEGVSAEMLREALDIAQAVLLWATTAAGRQAEES